MTRGRMAVYSGPGVQGATIYTMSSERDGEALVSVIFELGARVAFETFVAPTRREAWAAMATWVELQIASGGGVARA